MAKVPAVSVALKTSLLKGLKVFVYSGLSNAGPIWVAGVQEDMMWALLGPVINAVLYVVLRFLRERWPEARVSKVV